MRRTRQADESQVTERVTFGKHNDCTLVIHGKPVFTKDTMALADLIAHRILEPHRKATALARQVLAELSPASPGPVKRDTEQDRIKKQIARHEAELQRLKKKLV